MNDQLTKSHASLTEKVQHIETVLPSKLDRGEVGYLESIVSKMGLYDSFRTATTGRLDSLEDFQQSATIRLSAHDHHLRSVDHFCGGVTDDLKLKAEQQDVLSLAAEVRDHDRRMDSFALQSALKEVGGLQLDCAVC